MAEYLVQDASLTAVADAIRAKTGGTDALVFPDGMVSAIEGISGGSSGGVAMVWNGHARAECYSGIYTIAGV